MAILLLALMEVGVRIGVPLLNETQRRFHREIQQAQSMRPSRLDAPGQVGVLFVGNSLTFTDVDLDVLGKRGQNQYQVERWAVDDTNFLDWYYGLKRLFRNGARPAIVLVGGKGTHFTTSYFRGHFFSHYVLDWPDLGGALQEVHLSLTQQSDMVFAKGFALLGSREQLYKRAVGLVVPDFAKLAYLFTRSPSSGKPVASMPSDVLAQRIQRLKDLCEQNGARLVLWVPPTPFLDPQADLLQEASRKASVEVLRPVADGTLANDVFSDGFHMNAAGARDFTEKFVPHLERLLTQVRKTESSGNRPSASCPVNAGIASSTSLSF